MTGSNPGAPAGSTGEALARSADQDLMSRVVAGDHLAFGELHARYARRCVRVARGVLAQDEGVADVIQAVFLDIWRHAAPYDRSAGTVGSWILAITHHRAVDYVRREESQRRRRTQAARLAEPVLPEPDPATAMLRAAAQEELTQALARLAAAQREALVLAYYAGHSHSQIAAMLGIPLGTVKTRVRDGLRRLRIHLDAEPSSS